ncbi:IS66 family insertion sequence hypothetical protein, partial [Sinorhizobium medicae]
FARVEPVASSAVKIVLGDVVVRVGGDIESDHLAKILRAARHDRVRRCRLRVVPAGRLPKRCGILNGSGQRWRSRPVLMRRARLCGGARLGASRGPPNLEFSAT